MAETAQDGTNEGDVNDTPSTASRIKQSVVENAFPTPPRRSLHAGSLSRAGQTLAPPLRAALGIRRAASTPPDNRHDPSRQLYPQVPISRAETARSSDKLTWHKQELTKRKSQYLEKAFAIREPSYSAKDRVARDSLVLAEIKINSRVWSKLPTMSYTLIRCSWKKSKTSLSISLADCRRSTNVPPRAYL